MEDRSDLMEMGEGLPRWNSGEESTVRSERDALLRRVRSVLQSAAVDDDAIQNDVIDATDRTLLVYLPSDAPLDACEVVRVAGLCKLKSTLADECAQWRIALAAGGPERSVVIDRAGWATLRASGDWSDGGLEVLEFALRVLGRTSARWIESADRDREAGVNFIVTAVQECVAAKAVGGIVFLGSTFFVEGAPDERLEGAEPSSEEDCALSSWFAVVGGTVSEAETRLMADSFSVFGRRGDAREDAGIAFDVYAVGSDGSVTAAVLGECGSNHETATVVFQIVPNRGATEIEIVIPEGTLRAPLFGERTAII